MNNESYVQNIIVSMRKYQEENNIEKHCVTNAQYLYDIFKINTSINVKTRPVIIFSTNSEKDITTIVDAHLVIHMGNYDIVDPSYDVFCLENKTYFGNIKDFIKVFKDQIEIGYLKEIIGNFTHIAKLSSKINNGELTISDKDYYNSQADYIDKLYS